MNGHDIRFSVVVPLYNKAPYILAAIHSVLAQTFQDFEVVVVDDGSTDGGAELVERIGDPRLNLVRQANAGVSAARNHAIALARGEWIAFLDADDWHHPRFLGALVEAQSAFPAADMVATEYITVRHAEGKWPPQWPMLEDRPLQTGLIEDLPREYMSGPRIFTSGIAVRRRRLLSMQPCFPLGESRGEDLDLWFRLAERSPIALVHAPLAAYRVGIGDNPGEACPVLRIEPFMRRMHQRAVSGVLSATQRHSCLQLLAHFDLTMARQAIAAGRRVEALGWLLKGRYAIFRKRWWLTAVMAVSVPGHLVRKWEVWRVTRRSV